MANARLRMARQAGKRRRTSDAQPAEELASEMLSETGALNEPEPLKNELATSPMDDVHEAFRDQKQALETRLQELTMGKPLQKTLEPGHDVNGFRLKRTHRDFLLQEMEWMAADFAQERKWRLKSARVLALSVASFHSKRESRAARQQKLEDEAKRRLAARIGRDVKKFWTKIDKIISYKVKLQADELRKAAMDKHLKQLVSQTERYASVLAMTFQDAQDSEQQAMESDDTLMIEGGDVESNETVPEVAEDGRSAETSVEEQQRIQDRGEQVDAVAKQYAEQEAAADEVQDEGGHGRRRRRSSMQMTSPSLGHSSLEVVDQEPNQVQMESSVEPQVSGGDAIGGAKTRSRRGRVASNSTAAARADRAGESSDSDFAMPLAEEQDDEETIAIDEQLTTRAEVDEEMALLEEEGELSIDELRARYAAALESGASSDNGEDDDEPVIVEGTASSGDEDFEPSDEMIEDDERTIAAAEAADDFTSEEVDEEMKLLQEESELSLEELRARYTGVFAGGDDDDDDEALSENESSSKSVERGGEASDEDDEFQPTDEESDDESTIAAAEQNGPSRQEVDEELSLLQEEGELSIDELRVRYANATAEEDDGNDDGDGSEVFDNGDEAMDSTERKVPSEAANETSTATSGELAVAESQADSLADAERRGSLSTIAAPGTTITTAGFKRPYLLTSRLSLREYQEAGVNWLVSMCEKRINGILADEMGLGKTIQTISLLAHLACQRGIWGPHLIVVPTSCLVNWEMEFKRWCPAFKVLTYFGSAKRRKELRQGWSKQNAFQVCITSYQLVVQDAHCFKRKKWYYLILDEAHNIKNWKSLRWQTLLTFNSQRRLLLTGTPLQNNIMELWSLMHFLMPHVFSSRREFTYWFQNPLALMVEGEQDVNNQLVAQLHGIIRPFVLRRLKKDVAKQMPGKFEHVVTCKLSKRQRFLYEDFISRSSTRRAMFGKGGGRGGGANFMSMMNVLMQLRKVCNHPDLFEPRPIESPFDMPAIRFQAPSRCGFLMPDLVNEGRDLPYWNQSLNLPNLEIAGYEKYTSSRWRQLYYYDVNAPLSPDTQVSEETRVKYADKKDILRRLVQLAETRRAYWQQRRTQIAETSRLRVELVDEPMLGSDLVRVCTLPVFISHAMDVHVKRRTMSSPSSSSTQRARDWLTLSDAMSIMVRDPEERVANMREIVTRAVCYVPKARARPVEMLYGGSGFASSSAVSNQSFVLSRKLKLEALEDEIVKPVAQKCLNVYYDAFKRTQLFFPDKRLVQFDCGKLQQLDLLLRELKRGNHRCLIFTQMSSMLNILEIFLNIHGHTYFRLDGSTKVEKRQSFMDRFNRDEKIFCFILSTRSGGLGINLTGADSVIFYDSDWNPAMDAQAQDRAHRIGQTRDVHIYRLVSEHTVEENILKKAQQKRHLDFLVMAEGQFTTDFFSKANLRELVTGDESLLPDEESRFEEEEDEEPEMSYEALEDAMAQIEDEEDVVAMKGAKEEFMSEQREFEEETAGHASTANGARARAGSKGGDGGERRASIASVTKPSTPSSMSVNSSISGKDEEDDDDEDLESVDGSVAAAGDEVTESQGGEPADAADMVENEPNELQSDEEVDESGLQSSGDDVEDSMDDDDDDDIVHASRKRKRIASHTSTTSSKKAKSQRRQQQQRSGDPSMMTPATSNAQQQRAKEKAREKQMELEEERKLQAWKDSVSSLKGFEDSLNPVDRYALHFREQIDPLYSYVPTAAAIENYFDSQHGKLDVEKIEEEKMVEELNLIADGELIAGIMEVDGDNETSIASDTIDHLHRALYKKERAHVHFERRRRLLTGVAWELKKCAITNQPFYYNVDTREAIWDRPAIWAKNEQLELTQQRGFAGLMPSVLLTVMKCLSPFPDRHRVQLVCKTWRQAANHQSLFTRVNANDLYTRGLSLSQLLENVTFGDTVVFGSGVYPVDETVEVKTPIKLLAAPDAHVELQMTTGAAQLRWTARGGMLRGFHLTRQSQADAHELKDSDDGGSSTNWQHLLHVVNGGQVRVMYCDFDGSHQGNACVAVSGSSASRAVLLHNRIYNGGSSGVLLLKGDLVMVLNSIYANAHSGVSVLCGNALLRRNKIQRNGRFGIRLLYHAGNIIIEENIVSDHPCGSIDTENSGRRFVVRWNEMIKDEPEDLPHSHGKLRLKTFQIVEREIARKSSSSEKRKSLPTVSSAETSQVVTTPVALTSEPSTGDGSTLLPAAESIVLVALTLRNIADSAQTEPADAAESVSLQKPSDENSLGTKAVAPAEEKPEAARDGDDGSLVVKQAPVPEMATSATDAVQVNPEELAKTVVDGGVAASVITTLPEPVSGTIATPRSDEVTNAAAAETSAVGDTLTTTSSTTAAAATSSTAVVKAEPAAADNQPVKKKRKRRPKIEKLLVDGRVIVFHDTCEKRGDKVKKPRQFKNPRPEKNTLFGEAMKGGDPTSSTTSTPSKHLQPEQSENQADNSDLVAFFKRDTSTEEAQKTASDRTGDERAVLQPVTAAALSVTRLNVATSDPATDLGSTYADAPPVVVKKKRGRKPKVKPTSEALSVATTTAAAAPQ